MKYPRAARRTVQEHAAALTVEAQRLPDDFGRRQEWDGGAAHRQAYRDQLVAWRNARQLHSGARTMLSAGHPCVH